MDGMSMTMGGMGMPTTAMATTHPTSMPSMDMGMMGMGMMDMQQMQMTFYQSTSTTLFSKAWMPSSTGEYAGTCIFLAILAILLRLLYAFKVFIELKWQRHALQRKYIVTADDESDASSAAINSGKKNKEGVLTVKGVDEKVRIVESSTAITTKFSQPWRLSVDLPRACLFTVMVGVGYLLMLAVMTMNIGYFMSILAGSFVAELFVGRFIYQVEDHH